MSQLQKFVYLYSYICYKSATDLLLRWSTTELNADPGKWLIQEAHGEKSWDFFPRVGRCDAACWFVIGAECRSLHTNTRAHNFLGSICQSRPQSRPTLKAPGWGNKKPRLRPPLQWGWKRKRGRLKPKPESTECSTMQTISVVEEAH